MEQMSLYFPDEEIHTVKGIVLRSYNKVRKKYKRIDGETVEDFKEFIVCETYLEIAEELKRIALYRQKLNIDLRFDKGYDGN